MRRPSTEPTPCTDRISASAVYSARPLRAFLCVHGRSFLRRRCATAESTRHPVRPGLVHEPVLHVAQDCIHLDAQNLAQRFGGLDRIDRCTHLHRDREMIAAQIFRSALGDDPLGAPDDQRNYRTPASMAIRAAPDFISLISKLRLIVASG